MLPTEIIYEIYSHLGNTDKRKLRQTCRFYKDIKLDISLIFYYKQNPFLIEYCLDQYYDLIPQKYIDIKYLKIFVYTGSLKIIKKLDQSNLKNLCNLAAKYGK